MFRSLLARSTAVTTLLAGAVVAAGPAAHAADAPTFSIDNNCSYSVIVRYTYNGYTQEKRVRPTTGYLTARTTGRSVSTRTDGGKWRSHSITRQSQVFRFC